MDARLTRGDELVLHGFHHADDAPRPRSARDLFMRRQTTDTLVLRDAEAV